MSTSTSPTCGTPPSFFKTELERALSEQAFGIVNYSMQSASAFEAKASVVLLEQVQIIVTLTGRGYQVTGGTTSSIDSTIFETVDDLLQHCSPSYSAKRTELLVAKLTS